MVLTTYDVQTTSKSGQRRLAQVAKICKDYGQRVQNSVFECIVSPADFVELKAKLKKTIDMEEDSIRFYLMGSNWQKRVESMGKKTAFDPEQDSFIF